MSTQTQNTISNDHLKLATSRLTSLVDNNFECSICLDTFSDPHVIPECLHRFCGACVKESIRKCGAECPMCRARITTKRGLRKDNDFQDMMSMVLRTVKLLNQAKAEATDSERCAIKIETGTGTANEGGANSSSTSTIKRRSKRVPKGLCDQAMTDQDSSAAIMSKDMDNITARGVTRKRNAEYSSFKSRKKGTRTGSFEGRCKQLIDFKDEFGHCDVPRKFSADPSLGNWCRTMRGSYSKVQQGQTPHRNLTQDQIERLEEIGFKWKLGYQDRKTFEQRYHDLEVFKSEFGHCNVPFKYSVDLSLGNWCSGTRCAYDQIQRGQTPRSKLTQDQIERLDEIGFKWKCTDYGEIFEQRCCGLEAFKSEFGHCNVPCRYLANPLLGNWCSKQRCSYKKMQKGQTPKNNLTKDQIERLEGIGFKWKLE